MLNDTDKSSLLMELGHQYLHNRAAEDLEIYKMSHETGLTANEEEAVIEEYRELVENLILQESELLFEDAIKTVRMSRKGGVCNG